jgi:hypothetical protein
VFALLSVALLWALLSAQAVDQASHRSPSLAATQAALDKAALFAQCHDINMLHDGNSVYDLCKFSLDLEARFQSSLHPGKNNLPAFGTSLSDGQIHLAWV